VGVIGDTLSEARTRRDVDLEEIHAATGVRPRYLRAIEQEDWDALPEEFYARSFIRKYAQYLEVDPDPLVAEYRRQRGTSGGPGDAPTSPFARTSSRRADALRRRRRRQGLYAWLAAAALVAVFVVVLVLIASGGGSGGTKEANGGSGEGQGNAKGSHGGKGKDAGNGAAGKGKGAAGKTTGAGSAKTVKLQIEPTAEVWACVLDAKGKPLVDGLTLAAGETTGPFKSRSYSAAFGNGSVQISIDGKGVKTPETPSPMGFTVTTKGKVHDLAEGERPSCE
jgi:hypothetical protein